MVLPPAIRHILKERLGDSQPWIVQTWRVIHRHTGASGVVPEHKPLQLPPGSELSELPGTPCGAVPGLLLAWQQDEEFYHRFLLRNERDVRALFTDLLAADGLAKHAEATFDFLVNTTLVRAVTLGMADAAGYCERTADALAALFNSSARSR
jgi:hypothetical protein